MAIREITPGIWEASKTLKVAPGFHLPARMVVVETAPGELLLYSPLEITTELRDTIAELGDVRWIIAPNDYHHMFVGSAADAFPQAAIYGSAGAIRKQRDVSFTGSLADGPPPDLPDSVALFSIEGMPVVDESVLWLPDREALVCCDLVLNVQTRVPWLTRTILGFFLDHHDAPSQGKEYRWFFVKDRKAYAESMRQLLERPFDTLVMAHGEVATEGGNEALRRAVNWAL